MKIIFLGTRKLGYFGLKELIQQKHQILAIFTLDYDIKEGYDSKDFKKIADENKIPFYLTENINNPEHVNLFKKLGPDLIISLYWKRLLGDDIIRTARKGAVNIHYSLLPKYRGFAPVNWAVINNEKKAGVTLHYVNPGIADDGDIIAQKPFPIKEKDTIDDLYEKGNKIALDFVKKYIPLIEKNKEPRIKQKDKDALCSFARIPGDGMIDWKKSAKEIYNLIRAVTKPYPGAFTYCNNKKLYIWKADIVKDPIKYLGANGQVIRIIKGKGVQVLTGEGIIFLEIIQPENGKEINAGDYFKSIKTRLGYDVIEEIEKIKKRLNIE